MYRIRKQFKFEAAHVLETSFSKSCQKLHGHSYLLEIFLVGEKLNADGVVIDFGEVKARLAGFLSMIDHACFLPDGRKQLVGMTSFTWNENPTAENMAKIFYGQIKAMLALNDPIKLEKVRVHETNTGWAEYCE